MSSPPPLKNGAPPSAIRVPFSLDDLVRVLGSKAIENGRTLVQAGAVRLADSVGRIEADVQTLGRTFTVTISPATRGRRIEFERRCTCGRPTCAHMAAAALMALDDQPGWRQVSLFDLMDAPRVDRRLVAKALPVPRRGAAREMAGRQARWTLEPGQGEVALFVTGGLIPANGAEESADSLASPRDILALTGADTAGEADRAIARLLGGGLVRTPVAKAPTEVIDRLLVLLSSSDQLRWRDGTRLEGGPARTLQANRDPVSRKLRPLNLPADAILVRGVGLWCVDAAEGRLYRVKFRVVAPPGATTSAPGSSAPSSVQVSAGKFSAAKFSAAKTSTAEAPTIVDRAPIPVVRMGRVVSPWDGLVDALRLAFDYGDAEAPALVDAEDQRQFARLDDTDGTPLFVRRDTAAERAALERVATLGFVQGRIDPPKGALDGRGSRVHWLTGRESEERWRDFLDTHIPALRALGWRVEAEADFGTRVIEVGEAVAVAVRDAGDGWFDLDVGVEVDGVRRPLLPILASLVERGGLAAVRVTDGRALIALEDGTVLSLPADRVERLLSVLEAMLTVGRRDDSHLRLPLTEADALIDIDDLIARRPDETSRIEEYLRSLRAPEALPEVAVPERFRGDLRDYQRVGLAWLQALRANRLAGILADDMGLGKTAQTLAHIAVEHDAGRLTDPCLVVVPTSLVPNWVDEVRHFTPHLRVLVLHGLDRHERHHEVEDANIVVTTYGVVARDAERMARRTWHLLVLDESQAIKNSDSKVTRAVCTLQARHRLCLSGTPVENNLGELWSQFAFLMPSLLGDRKAFQKRFRTPIEKRGDATRANLLMRRIRPFLLRRTKGEVAKELPPKTEIIQRIELGREQRDLYETIRLSVHETVRAAIAASGVGRNAITVIDALLKLRQVCCDPRLVKIPAAKSVHEAAKLTALIDMVTEMVPEGRRILLFSQFTTMLDLIKTELQRAGIAFVELTGKTVDRAEPVARFQRGEVPVFLISLKAGGRGLNLTAADTVIHYDPWWNPAAEDQATDRAYRIGQDKPVFVYKLIATDTVEERILELQRRKGNLSAATLEGAGLVSALADTDIDFLFGGETSAP